MQESQKCRILLSQLVIAIGTDRTCLYFILNPSFRWSQEILKNRNCFLVLMMIIQYSFLFLFSGTLDKKLFILPLGRCCPRSNSTKGQRDIFWYCTLPQKNYCWKSRPKSENIPKDACRWKILGCVQCGFVPVDGIVVIFVLQKVFANLAAQFRSWQIKT